jgi:hypothetical protein
LALVICYSRAQTSALNKPTPECTVGCNENKKIDGALNLTDNLEQMSTSLIYLFLFVPQFPLVPAEH